MHWMTGRFSYNYQSDLMKHIRLTLAAAGTLFAAAAHAAAPGGGITPEMYGKIKSAYEGTASDRAIYNAISNNAINSLAVNTDSKRSLDDHFSHRVPSKGITNQKSSGRCWLFTGLNVLRAQMMAEHNLPELKLSQNYNFFFDQLEKSNLFLQGVIDYADQPMDSKMNEWLFQHPLSDGGQFTGIADIITKYGVVPAEVMPETNSADNTSTMRQLISLKLREDGLELRKMAAEKRPAADIEARKTEMLGEIYRMLALNLGEPPAQFEWTRRDKNGNVVDTRTYTPLEFYRQFAGNDLKNNYVMLMNDPSREYWKLYEIDFDRHTYDGQNWTYVNVPMDVIKKAAIESIKDSTAMYFSCDVGKFFDRDRGLLDTEAYDYESLFGVTFGMDKAQRIATGASASSHAMTLVAVDLDENEQPRKWLVENSWGKTANDGHLIITDKWMDEYMFRLVVERKFVPKKVLDVLKQTPVRLPAWDPLFTPDE